MCAVKNGISEWSVDRTEVSWNYHLSGIRFRALRLGPSIDAITIHWQQQCIYALV
jgi:hypothetical protein